MQKQNGTMELSIRAYTDRLNSFNRVLDQRDEDIRVQQIKIRDLEDIQRAKIKELQDAQAKLDTQNRRVEMLLKKLDEERLISRACRVELKKAEKKLGLASGPLDTPERRSEQLLEELAVLAETHGEDSEEYKKKQKKLNRFLEAIHKDNQRICTTMGESSAQRKG